LWVEKCRLSKPICRMYASREYRLGLKLQLTSSSAKAEGPRDAINNAIR